MMRAAIALLVAFSLTVCWGCQREPSARGGATSATQRVQRLTTATVSDPTTFNPILITDSPSSDALDDIFEGLVRTNPKTTEIEPLLAERWEFNEDGTECTFHLRRDVRWHDGHPFTAQDVAFTYRAVFDDRVPNSSRHVLTIDGKPFDLEVVDDHTVRVVLPRPFAPLLNSISTPIVPEHILGEFLRRGTFAQQWGIDTPPEKLIGTGPFRMVQFKQAQYIRFQRNPDYWMQDDDGQRLPYLEERMTLIVPNQDTLYMKFRAGETDVHMPRPEEIAELQSRQDESAIRVAEVGIDTGTLFVTFNRNPRHYTKSGKRDPRLNWFTDKPFLKAIAHAMDKQAMVVNCFSGYGVPAVANVSPANTLFHNPNLADYEYDLEKSRHLLAEGGYLDRDGDGIREDRDGNPLEFDLHTNAGNQLREKMCAMLQEDWTKLGLKVNYRPLEFPTLVEKLDTTFDWDAVLIGFTGGLEPHNGANVLRSSGNLHMWNPGQPSPQTDWERAIDELVEKGSRELDPQKRKQYYWEIQRILHQELPMIQTVRQRGFVAVRRHVANYQLFVWGLYQPERIRIAE